VLHRLHGPRDVRRQSKSRQLYTTDCRHRFYSKSTTKSQQWSWSITTDRRVVNSRNVSTVGDVVNKLDRRRILLTTGPTCCGEFCKSRVLDKVPEGSVLISNFLTTLCGMVERSLRAINSSICPVISMQYGRRCQLMAKAGERFAPGHCPSPDIVQPICQ